jgi:hypothetical protein
MVFVGGKKGIKASSSYSSPSSSWRQQLCSYFSLRSHSEILGKHGGAGETKVLYCVVIRPLDQFDFLFRFLALRRRLCRDPALSILCYCCSAAGPAAATIGRFAIHGATAKATVK